MISILYGRFGVSSHLELCSVGISFIELRKLIILFYYFCLLFTNVYKLIRFDIFFQHLNHRDSLLSIISYLSFPIIITATQYDHVNFLGR